MSEDTDNGIFKKELEKIVGQADAAYPEGSKRNRVIDRVVRRMTDLVTIDQPLPISELSRYLATICIAEVGRNEGRDRREWISLAMHLFRTEHAARRLDNANTAERMARSQMTEDILEAADELYQAEFHDEYHTDDEVGRPKKGRKNKAGKG